jgi:DNA-binding NtrC family response regulator
MVKQPCIVVIDDDTEICGLLRDVLAAEGYSVSTACDPAEGVWMVKTLEPDLVMLDMKMPKMSGMDVLRWIKKTDEAIPVIIMTAFGTADSEKAAMRLGAFDYIAKPFDLASVKALVKKALSGTGQPRGSDCVVERTRRRKARSPRRSPEARPAGTQRSDGRSGCGYD